MSTQISKPRRSMRPRGSVTNGRRKQIYIDGDLAEKGSILAANEDESFSELLARLLRKELLAEERKKAKGGVAP